ncbi:DeoR/GlpR family DNA-binding transcription regulator [Tistrella bauzanensis]|uniref:DeoR/GlpR family DNA-binding transcription regulator n=1 Tax=Tistrella arctica TaxID=3133430 RepID=A0ABU9YI45_9PROT
MLQDERHQRILAMLATFGRMSTDRIAADLAVSRETVRRDVLELDARGALRRVHGGVVSIDPPAEPSLGERALIRQAQKRSIARAAASIVRAGQTLFIDAGTTVSALADELATLNGLTIITNSFDVAARIMIAGREDRGHRVFQIGGQVAPGAAATLGAAAIAGIARYRVDMAMLSPVGIDSTDGATSFDHDEAEIARAMADRADRVVILADHAKIGQRSRVSYCIPDRIDLLVTDMGARDLAELDRLRQLVGEVIIG